MKKLLAFTIILLFIGMSVIPSTGTTVERKSIMPTFYDGNTLYVGGLGPGNYTTIQAAIDDASNGDTVYVYDDSSPYYEHVDVDKSINLIGEDRNTTIIDGSGSGVIVTTSADGIVISEFTLQHGRNGIYLNSNSNQIINDIIKKNSRGIEIFDYGSNNTVRKNRIIQNDYGIHIEDHEKKCNNNLFTENFIAHNHHARIYDNDRLYGGTIATWNVIADNGWQSSYYHAGVWKHDSDSIYHHNDFFFNPDNAIVNGGRNGCDWDDGSEGNYWDDWSSNPGYPDTYIIPSDLSEEIDWHPCANRWTNALVVVGSSSMGYGIIYILVNDTINFYCKKSGGVAPYSYHWDFGDGNTSDEKNPTHTFVTPGSYEVTITVVDHVYNSDTDIAVNVNVGTGPPYAPNITGPTFVKQGVEYVYEFVAIDPDGEDVTYLIDFGYGEYEYGPYKSGEKVDFFVIWPEVGNFTIKACARDGTYLYGPWSNLTGVIIPEKAIIKPESGMYIRNQKIRKYLFPFRNPIIIGDIDIEIDFSDVKFEIEKVEFYIDGKLKAIDTIEPFTWTWSDTTFFIHRIKVAVYAFNENNVNYYLTVWKFF